MNELQTISFKNRPYLLYLSIPLVLTCFLLTAFILFGLLGAESLLLFLLLFLVELELIVGILAKYRYVPSGTFKFNKDFYEYDGFRKFWTQVRSVDVFYRGDSFWSSKYPLFQWYKAYRRYRNLNYVAVPGYNEKLVDKIIIDGRPIYFKIKTTQEKMVFFKIRDFAISNNVNMTDTSTDFSYMVLGRTFGK